MSMSESKWAVIIILVLVLFARGHIRSKLGELIDYLVPPDDDEIPL